MDEKVVVIGAGGGIGLRAALLASSLSQNGMCASPGGALSGLVIRPGSIKGGFSAELLFELENTIAEKTGITVNQARSAIRGFERSVLDVAKHIHQINEVPSFENEYTEPVWVSRKKGEGVQKEFGQSKHNNR